MKIVEKNINELVMYENNPRKNDKAVKYVAESIKEFGFLNPIIVDRDNVIVAGHTRLKAARQLKMDIVPCIVADELTPEQIKAFRLADNKVAEFSDWDNDLLVAELKDIINIDMSQFGFTDLSLDEQEEKYSMATNIPQYEITGECPALSEMLNTDKAESLIAEINNSNVTDEEKVFLIEAAKRHNVFNYRNIAEYYAHATPEMQDLMEKSALVIIDIDNAIANGYTTLTNTITDLLDEEDE